MQKLVLLAVALVPTSALAEEAAEEPAGEPAVDTASVSCGRVNRGGLAAAAALEAEGPGFVVPEPWRTRGLRYGTEELVGMIRRAAAAVERDHPGALLGVADLSRRHGGSAPHHRSHQAGRDVDLIYYALDDDAGAPVAPGGCMPSYGPDRRASRCYHPQQLDVAPRRFDVVRNWTLVRALLTDGHARVRVIFMSLGIRNWLLEEAARRGEPRVLIRRAERILMRPPGGRAHTDHMHVRIACTLDDRRRGRCRNDPDLRGRWFGRVRCPRRPPQVASAPAAAKQQ
jgi:penicillin-insensitive murein endopeptidase